MAKTKKIGGFWASILTIALNGMKIFIDRINHDPSRKILEGMRLAFVKLVGALSDADPDDDKQVQAIINETLTQGEFYQGSRSTIVANLNKIQNVQVQTLLLNLVDPAYDIAGLLTDEEKDNEQQIKELLTSLAVSDKGLETIVALLSLVFDEEAAAFIGAVIASYLERLFEDDPEQATALDLSKEYVIALRQKYEAIANAA